MGGFKIARHIQRRSREAASIIARVAVPQWTGSTSRDCCVFARHYHVGGDELVQRIAGASGFGAVRPRDRLAPAHWLFGRVDHGLRLHHGVRSAPTVGLVRARQCQMGDVGSTGAKVQGPGLARVEAKAGATNLRHGIYSSVPTSERCRAGRCYPIRIRPRRPPQLPIRVAPRSGPERAGKASRDRCTIDLRKDRPAQGCGGGRP